MEEYYNRGAVPRLDCIVTVVDALRMKDEFDCSVGLTKKEIGEDDIENLIIEQVEFCNIILLNKISEVSSEEGGRIRAIIRALQPKAKIIECDYADVELDEIIGTGMFSFEKVATSAAWIRELEHHDEEDDDDDDDDDHHHHGHHHHDHEHDHHHHPHEEGEAEEYGIQTFVYYRRPAFDLNKFDRFLATQFPKNIIRTKGVVYFNHNRDMSFLFEQAGSQKKLTQAGLWFATASEEELRQLMMTEPGLAKDWDPVYGDRMIKLVIIGQNLDRKEIESLLDFCLVHR